MVAFCVLATGPQASVLANAASVVRVQAKDEDASRDARGPVEELASELKALVAKDMGKPLAPSKIHFVSALPKTRNAKVMRRVLRSAYLGEDPGDLSALENPHAVEEIRSVGK
jgi:acetyl-CoA synthetase